MNAASAFSRLWRRLTLRLRTVRQVPQPLLVPASTAVGVNQFPEGRGSDSHGDSFSVLVVNETDQKLLVSVEVEQRRDRMRVWIRDA